MSHKFRVQGTGDRVQGSDGDKRLLL
jgi:hypothetical protein